jgi:hypothetical protein
MYLTVERGRVEVSKVFQCDLNNAIEGKDFKEPPLEEIVLEQYHEFLSLLKKVLVDCLPIH